MALRQSVSESEYLEIKRLQAAGMSQCRIARTLGKTQWTVVMAIDPTMRQRRNYLARKRRREDRKKWAEYMSVGRKTAGIHNDYAVTLPQSVIEERDRYLAFEHTDNTARLLGDPPPWRSALAQKERENGSKPSDRRSVLLRGITSDHAGASRSVEYLAPGDRFHNGPSRWMGR